jgi:hypothetical protein
MQVEDEERVTRVRHLTRTGKNNGMPFSFKVSLISIHPTPGWQTRSESSSESRDHPVDGGEHRLESGNIPWIAIILSIPDMSTHMPPSFHCRDKTNRVLGSDVELHEGGELRTPAK